MPRNYGRFTTSIWADPDFTSLTVAQQGFYFTLGLQSEVTAAGTLALTSRRWARLSAGTTRAQVETLIAELAAHPGRHLVVDDDTEELLIRKFIKWDNGWYNEKRWPVVRDSVAAIASTRIRHAAVDELRKLAHADMASDTASRRVLDWLSHKASDGESGFDRVGVTLVDHNPQPSTLNLEGEPQPLDTAEPPSMFCDQHPNGTTDPCGPCGTRRRQFDAWHERDARQQADVREFARSNLRRCGRCNGDGFVEDHAGQLVERCDHSPAVVSA